MADRDSPETPSDPLEDTRLDVDNAAPVQREAPLPRAFGRYAVQARLGAGGMGAVYLAVDPDLEREVAIKVLHADIADEHRERLFAEAKTMARVIHPNVVSVFDIGEQDGQIFVAMERVDGGTLREWSKAERRGWREIVAMLRDAARGLHAAHREGIVHRDFKPDNVLVGRNHAVKVTDFGLARARESALGHAGESIGVCTDGADVGSDGKLSGSPSYMAPETIRGDRPSARADQFSFCVTLYECLCGKRPFTGESLIAVLAQITSGARQARPTDVRLPARLWQVIDRGLDRDPSRRFPTMQALADALDDCLVPPWRRWVAPMIGTAVVGSAIAGAMWGQAAATNPCKDARSRLAGVWDPARATALDTSLAAVDVPYGATTREQVRRRLDAYAASWVERHTDACEATHVHEVQDADVLALRVRCLDERRASLQRTVELLEDADASMMEHAIEMVAELPRLTRCDDVAALQAETPPPDDPAQLAEADALRDLLPGPRAQMQGGRIGDAIGTVESLLARADALGYAPLQLDARLLYGQALQSEGRYAAAETELAAAFELAVSLGDDESASIAADGLTYVVGLQLARMDPARVWARNAEGFARRVDPEGPVLASAMNSVGIVLATSGDLDGAAERFEHALRILDAQPGGPGPDLSSALNSLGNLRTLQGRYDEAMAVYRRAEAVAIEVSGAAHPTVASAIINLAVLQYRLGDAQASLASYDRALAIQERAYGGDHPSVAYALNNVAVIYDEQKRLDEAMPLYERALRIRERAMGPEHPLVGETLNNMGLSRQYADDHRGALGYLLRSLAIFEKADHRGIDAVLYEASVSEIELGLLDDARAHRERALDRARGRTDDARMLPRAELNLAEVRWLQGDRAGARVLIEQSRAHAAPDDTTLRVELDRWAAEHPD